MKVGEKGFTVLLLPALHAGKTLGTGLSFAVFQHDDSPRGQERGVAIQKFHHHRRPSLEVRGISEDDVETPPFPAEITHSLGNMGNKNLHSQRLSLLNEAFPLFPEKLHRHHRGSPPPGSLESDLTGSRKKIQKRSSLQRPQSTEKSKLHLP
jgi:hypothetical protein